MTKPSKAAQERALAQQAAKSLTDRDNYSAKQVAARLGTDARTFRKFLRSSHSTAEAVGQGKRYDFSADNFGKVKQEFLAWRAFSEARRPGAKVTPQPTKPTPKPIDPAKDEVKSSVPYEGSIQQSIDELHARAKLEFYPAEAEPTEEELRAIEEGDLD